MEATQGNGRVLKGTCALLALGLLAVLAFSVFDLRITSSGSGSLKPEFPPGGPAEFLYLDSERVAAYLAQVNGGTFDSERLTRKLTQSVNAKVGLQGSELGGSSAEEALTEREVKPTAASSFFALLAALKKASDVISIRLRYFEEDVEPLREGRFVSFKTSALLSPVYLNAYLAVKHGSTSAIFPNSSARRKQAEGFETKVGETPRVVFALQPTTPSPGEDGTASTSEATTELKPFVYLMPMNALLLTAERSLLKYGGGQFTVVGKLVRRFPEPSRNHFPVYVDSPTLETWEQPLRHAPGELLCRTDPHCAAEVRQAHMRGRRRRRAIGECRERILAGLETQTAIPRRGAVILPVAIYK